jgi:hypothetical protein
VGHRALVRVLRGHSRRWRSRAPANTATRVRRRLLRCVLQWSRHGVRDSAASHTERVLQSVRGDWWRCCPGGTGRGGRHRPPVFARQHAAKKRRPLALRGFGVTPPGTHRDERVQRGATSAPCMCAPCAARDPHGCGRSPCTPCSSHPRSACTTGSCRGSKGAKGALVRRTSRHGGARPSRRWSPCAPWRLETLYMTPRPAQSRPTRSARAWWPCSGRS